MRPTRSSPGVVYGVVHRRRRHRLHNLFQFDGVKVRLRFGLKRHHPRRSNVNAHIVGRLARRAPPCSCPDPRRLPSCPGIVPPRTCSRTRPSTVTPRVSSSVTVSVTLSDGADNAIAAACASRDGERSCPAHPHHCPRAVTVTAPVLAVSPAADRQRLVLAQRECRPRPPEIPLQLQPSASQPGSRRRSGKSPPPCSHCRRRILGDRCPESASASPSALPSSSLIVPLAGARAFDGARHRRIGRSTEGDDNRLIGLVQRVALDLDDDRAAGVARGIARLVVAGVS